MSTKKKIVLMKKTGSATKWSSCFLNQIEITKLDFLIKLWTLLDAPQGSIQDIKKLERPPPCWNSNKVYPEEHTVVLENLTQK